MTSLPKVVNVYLEMNRLLLVIAIAFLLAIAGCTDTSDDDPMEEIEVSADTDDPAESDDESETDDESTDTEGSADDEDEDDKDPPDSDTEDGSDTDESDTDESETDDTDTDDSDTDSEANTDDEDEVTAPGDGELEVHAINVGQADATLLIGPSGDTMLIDSGDWRDDGETVLEYLDSRDIDRLDHLVSTHGHADHIGGHAAVIEEFETEKNGIGQVWDSGVTHTSQTYERYLDAVDDHDVTLFETQEGDEILIEGVDVTVLSPPADSPQPDDLHYNSVSVLVEHGEIGFLATGDAERDAEERLVAEYGYDLEAEIYHAGHHGSTTSSTSQFLDAVDPEVSIISSAYDSQYGHPHEEVLTRFTEREIGAVWTAVHGSTVFTSDGNSYSVIAQADATTTPVALRDEPEITADPVATPEYQLDSTDIEGVELPEDADETEEDDTEEEEDDTEDETDDNETEQDYDSNLVIEPDTASAAAEHTWSYDELDFSGEIDDISVEYPDGSSLDGLTNEDITVTMTRTMSDGVDTSEIRVNQGSYAGTSATFDLDGRHNTDIAGFVEVVIDGVEKPPAGEHTATITFSGEDDDITITEEFTTE